MTNRFFRLAVMLLGSLALAVSPVLSQPLATSAASASTLFGWTGSLVTVDPSTGASTPFADLPPDPNVQGTSGGPVDDPIHHELYIDRVRYIDQTVFPQVTADQIVTVDSQTGTGSVSPNLAQQLSGLAFDPSTNSLFGVTQGAPFELVRIDPSTGVETDFAALSGDNLSQMTVSPAKHALYVGSRSFASFPAVQTILTVNTLTGAVSQSGALTRGVFSLAYDTSSATLLGKTFCCPANLVRIDPATGSENQVGTVDMSYGSPLAVDPTSHTVFVMEDVFTGFGFNQQLATINDQTGSSTVGPLLPFTQYIGALIFEPAAVVITPDSIKSDVQTAFANGAISNAGVKTSLLSELTTAANARSRGQCSTAARVYGAFINEVEAQSGKAIAADTATKLTSEAQYLIANCP